jgi:hypothetical protein
MPIYKSDQGFIIRCDGIGCPEHHIVVEKWEGMVSFLPHFPSVSFFTRIRNALKYIFYKQSPYEEVLLYRATALNLIEELAAFYTDERLLASMMKSLREVKNDH